VVAGFAGSTADCLTLIDRLERKLEEYPGIISCSPGPVGNSCMVGIVCVCMSGTIIDQLMRASVEMAKQWRTDKYLRHLEAWMIAADKDQSLTLTGNGDVIAGPANGVVGNFLSSLFASSLLLSISQ
jgi:ATP-dependent HslUV protease subunit HslV